MRFFSFFIACPFNNFSIFILLICIPSYFCSLSGFLATKVNRWNCPGKIPSSVASHTTVFTFPALSFCSSTFHPGTGSYCWNSTPDGIFNVTFVVATFFSTGTFIVYVSQEPMSEVAGFTVTCALTGNEKFPLQLLLLSLLFLIFYTFHFPFTPFHL